jgi:hypothetical protein
MHSPVRTTTLAALLLALPAWALPSGPAAGEKIAPLKVYAATGPQKEKELDYAAERKEQPTVYVLIRDWDRPVARFLKTLDGAVKEDSARTEVVAVWLTDQQEQTKTYLPLAQQSLKMEVTSLSVFLGDKGGPDGWNVNPDARVTVVVADKGKAAASFGYNSINETDVREVRQAVKKVVGGQ